MEWSQLKPSPPRPPALVTAAASSGRETRPIGAETMGCRTPSRRVKGVTIGPSASMKVLPFLNPCPFELYHTRGNATLRSPRPRTSDRLDELIVCDFAPLPPCTQRRALTEVLSRLRLAPNWPALTNLESITCEKAARAPSVQAGRGRSNLQCLLYAALDLVLRSGRFVRSAP